MPSTVPPITTRMAHFAVRRRKIRSQAIRMSWMSCAMFGPVDSDMKVIAMASSVFQSRPVVRS